MPAARRPRGRPRLSPGEDSTALYVRMPVGQFDRLHTLATRYQVSMPSLVRAAVTRLLKAADTTPRPEDV